MISLKRRQWMSKVKNLRGTEDLRQWAGELHCQPEEGSVTIGVLWNPNRNRNRKNRDRLSGTGSNIKWNTEVKKVKKMLKKPKLR
jgi:hypothetical protein